MLDFEKLKAAIVADLTAFRDGHRAEVIVANVALAAFGVPVSDDLSPATQAKIDEIDELVKQQKAQLTGAISPPA